MLMPVGNMNDKRGINANPGAAKSTDWSPAPALPLERRRLGGRERGESMGTVLLRGLVFRLLNIRKTTSKSESLYSDNVNNCFKTGARRLEMCLWFLLLFLLRVVAGFTGWMVDKAFKELSASCTSSSSSPARRPACL